MPGVNPWAIVVPASVAAGSGLAAWGAMHPAAQLYGPVVRYTGLPNTIALTFDDGPNPSVTPRLLDLLEQQGAHATFFLIGRFVRECPGLVRETAARGHLLANHTETHPNLFWLSARRIHEELARCAEAICEATRELRAALEPRWMRPPFGLRGPQLDAVVRQQGFQGVVTWSVIAYDWKPQPAARLIRRLNGVARGDRARRGEILVLHDGDHRRLNGERRHVVEALGHWLPRWRDAGLRFVRMDEIGRGEAS